MSALVKLSFPLTTDVLYGQPLMYLCMGLNLHIVPKKVYCVFGNLNFNNLGLENIQNLGGKAKILRNVRPY